MSRGAVLGVVVVLVGGLAAAAFFVSGDRPSGSAEGRALVEAANAVLRADELERTRAAELSRQISALTETDGDRSLVRALAKLELALGRVQSAWQVHGAVTGLDPETPDLLLSARILLRRHALLGGDALADAESAAHLAARHHDASGEPGSLFLAWQGMRRAGELEDAAAQAEALAGQHPESLPGRLVSLFSGGQVTLEKLRQLELEYLRAPHELHCVRVPEELEAGIARLLLSPGEGQEEPSDGNVGEAMERLERVLVTFPSSVDARSALALALHLSGDPERRDLHLDWLLANADPDDTRRPTWRGLKEL